MRGEIIEVRAAGRRASPAEVDPVLTEVIRQGLSAAAEQMKIALCRTAHSPILYEIIDFACGIFDTECRMLAQARAMPSFLGTLSFGLEAAIDRLGGLETFQEGDVVWSTDAYDNGSHPQDAVLIVPAFHDGVLVGFGVTKAHHMDIAAKDLYCTDTTDVFQEGVIFPAVRVYRAGVLQDDIWRTVLANSRLPEALEGDWHAQLAAANAGVAGLLRIVGRYGPDRFADAVELMLNHGEMAMRELIASIPDGRYVGACAMDNDGIGDEPIEFRVAVEISGDEALVDWTDCPDHTTGPVNTPLASTVTMSRLAIAFLRGGVDRPNEGHFRPITVRVRDASMFCARSPAPIFLYGWSCDHGVDAIHREMAKVLPHSVTASSGGDLCGVIIWGERRDGTWWATGFDHPVGQGATVDGDGGPPLFVMSGSGIRTPPSEVIEARSPVRIEKYELAADSLGPGRYRGGAGVDVEYTLLEDTYMTTVFERTRVAPWGIDGGGTARANRISAVRPDGTVEWYTKATRALLPAGTTLRAWSGGGGGWGSPSERPPDAVVADIEEGYITARFAAEQYPMVEEASR
jgi:N-methylhydantoinase B